MATICGKAWHDELTHTGGESGDHNNAHTGKRNEMNDEPLELKLKLCMIYQYPNKSANRNEFGKERAEFCES